MDNKILFKIIVIIVLILILGIIVKLVISTDNGNTNISSNNQSTSKTTNTTNTENNSSTEIIETSTNLSIADVTSENYTSYTAKINLNNLSVDGSGVSISNNTITINKEGVYYFTGTLSDGNIVVNADSAKVVLVFENVNITSTKTAVINVIKAKTVTLNLIDGSTNVFTDSSNYTEFTEDDEPNGTIFSKSDLYITGSGTLKVYANYQDGIVSKDTLAIVDATIEVTSADDGIRGKDFTSIKNAKITVNSKGDGIKSTNDSDTSLGYVIIDGATINVTSENDGIQAETVLNISNSNINITTTGKVSSSSDVSSKGLKAGKEITINGGNYAITSTDDTIHSNGCVIINNGNFELSSGDDGIHGDSNILINNGTITIKKSYEGIEANYIKINDGKISIIASDDGINVSGGDGSQMMGPRGGDSFGSTSDSNRQLVINGGNIYVKSEGDGLDANGSINMNGGYVLVVGTTSNGNGALDYDQSFNVTGGTLIVYGAAGMWQNPSTTSKQYSICFGAAGSSGDSIVLKDSNGNEIVSFKTEKNYSAVTISSSSLKQGETYTLYVNGTSAGSQEITSIVTSNMTNSGGMNGGMQGGGMQRQMNR